MIDVFERLTARNGYAVNRPPLDKLIADIRSVREAACELLNREAVEEDL
jgi:hypothetical protein